MSWHDVGDEIEQPAAASVSVAREPRAMQSLERKPDAAAQKAADLQSEREQFSHAAHTGDKSARRRLTELHREIAEHYQRGG